MKPIIQRCHIQAILACAAALLLAPLCAGQSLFQRPISPNPAAEPAQGENTTGDGTKKEGAPAPAAQADASGLPTMQDASLFSVTPPKPRVWQKHDKVELIINQVSLQSAEQTLETKKKYDLKAELKQFPSLAKLIEDATLGDGIGSVGPKGEFSGSDDYKGTGKGERKDRFTARISAIVVDVKPNGHLLLEARETQQFDADTKTLVVAGLCDPKDITIQGTVLSTQVANLTIKVENSGDVKDGATKGWIPRVLDAIFGL